MSSPEPEVGSSTLPGAIPVADAAVSRSGCQVLRMIGLNRKDRQQEKRSTGGPLSGLEDLRCGLLPGFRFCFLSLRLSLLDGGFCLLHFSINFLRT